MITSAFSLFDSCLFNASENLLPVCMDASSTLATYSTGLSVSKKKSAMAAFSSFVKPSSRIFFPFPNGHCIASILPIHAFNFGSQFLAVFQCAEFFFQHFPDPSTVVLYQLFLYQLTGLIGPSSRKIFSSSKHRTT